MAAACKRQASKRSSLRVPNSTGVSFEFPPAALIMCVRRIGPTHAHGIIAGGVAVVLGGRSSWAQWLRCILSAQALRTRAVPIASALIVITCQSGGACASTVHWVLGHVYSCYVRYWRASGRWVRMTKRSRNSTQFCVVHKCTLSRCCCRQCGMVARKSTPPVRASVCEHRGAAAPERIRYTLHSGVRASPCDIQKHAQTAHKKASCMMRFAPACARIDSSGYRRVQENRLKGVRVRERGKKRVGALVVIGRRVMHKRNRDKCAFPEARPPTLRAYGRQVGDRKSMAQPTWSAPRRLRMRVTRMMQKQKSQACVAAHKTHGPLSDVSPPPRARTPTTSPLYAHSYVSRANLIRRASSQGVIDYVRLSVPVLSQSRPLSHIRTSAVSLRVVSAFDSASSDCSSSECFNVLSPEVVGP